MIVESAFATSSNSAFSMASLGFAGTSGKACGIAGLWIGR